MDKINKALANVSAASQEIAVNTLEVTEHQNGLFTEFKDVATVASVEIVGLKEHATASQIRKWNLRVSSTRSYQVRVSSGIVLLQVRVQGTSSTLLLNAKQLNSNVKALQIPS